MPRKKREVDRATAVSDEPSDSVDEKITATRKHVDAMQKSQEWAGAPDVQKAAGEWDGAANDLETNANLISSLQMQLDMARLNELVLVRRWNMKRRACIQAVSAHAD